MSASVICGDCLEVMPTLEAESVDAIVSDPPYGLSFMGKNWDKGVPGVAFWTEALRVTKPGSYLLAFGGTRTYHRLACAIEDAGFEIQDCLSWLYGSGFPKHKSKLKPAWEPIIMARKPAPKATLLNIDACRIGRAADDVSGWSITGAKPSPNRAMSGGNYAREPKPDNAGRWPANVLLDSEAAEALDAQAGTLTSGANPTRRGGLGYHGAAGQESAFAPRGTGSGGASRFFYTSKASRSEREAGLEGFAERRGGAEQYDSRWKEGAGELRQPVVRNGHPTVKPIAVMRWLCKLVTPPNGLILDPFTGSGTTGCAAVLEGFRFIGIEKESEYAEIARKRIFETPPSLFGDVA